MIKFDSSWFWLIKANDGRIWLQILGSRFIQQKSLRFSLSSSRRQPQKDPKKSLHRPFDSKRKLDQPHGLKSGKETNCFNYYIYASSSQIFQVCQHSAVTLVTPRVRFMQLCQSKLVHKRAGSKACEATVPCTHFDVLLVTLPTRIKSGLCLMFTILLQLAPAASRPGWLCTGASLGHRRPFPASSASGSGGAPQWGDALTSQGTVPSRVT